MRWLTVCNVKTDGSKSEECAPQLHSPFMQMCTPWQLVMFTQELSGKKKYHVCTFSFSWAHFGGQRGYLLKPVNTTGTPRNMTVKHFFS